MATLLSRAKGAFRPGVRMMSGHSAEEAMAEMDKWKKFSYIAIPFVTAVTVYVFGTHKHVHHHEVEYQYITRRLKPMPWTLWGGSKCDLFDYTCGAKEKAAKAALKD